MSRMRLVFVIVVLASVSVHVAAEELDHVVITPESAKVALVGTVQFTAKGYDEAGNKLADVTFEWSVIHGGGSIDENGLFTAGMETGFYENTVQVKATWGNVTRVAYASVNIVKPLDVEVRISELPWAEGYMYTCLVENIGMETCDSFTIKYSGNEPVYHSEPEHWRYKAEAGTIWWTIATYESERIDPGQTRLLYFMLAQQLSQIDWQAKYTPTGNLDFGSVESFVNAPLSPLNVEVNVSVDQGLDGYLYTFFVKNIGGKTCNHFWVRYGEGDNTTTDHSEPEHWSYEAGAGTIWWTIATYQSERIRSGNTRSFYFTIPHESSRIYWRAKYTPTGDLDIGSVYFEVAPPSIAQVTPEIGPAKQLITITGAGFVDGATAVTFSNIPATNVNVISPTELTVSAPEGNEDGWVDVQIQTSGGSVTRSRAFRYYSEVSTEIIDTFTAQIALTQGVNMISLPLNPDRPYVASSLAEELGATVVIRLEEGNFDAYVHTGRVGTDFNIEMGKGYIVNVLESQVFEVTGQPWGVPAAPPDSKPSAPWAFVVAGWIDGAIPAGARLCVMNPRTAGSLIVPILPSGEFTAAFVDMSQRPVVAAGDEIMIQLINSDDVSLTEAERHRISQEHIAQAYLLTRLSATPEKTQLLQNYPNPFNPETWIPFQLAQPALVRIDIHDLNGRLVRHLDLGYRPAGCHLPKEQAAYWNGCNEAGEEVSSGVYFYCLHAGDFSAQRKLVMLR